MEMVRVIHPQSPKKSPKFNGRLSKLSNVRMIVSKKWNDVVQHSNLRNTTRITISNKVYLTLHAYVDSLHTNCTFTNIIIHSLNFPFKLFNSSSYKMMTFRVLFGFFCIAFTFAASYIMHMAIICVYMLIINHVQCIMWKEKIVFLVHNRI